MLLGDPTRPPYVGTAIFVAVVMAGAVLWWRFGYGPGLAAIVVGANIGLVVLGMNLEDRGNRRRMWWALTHPVIGGGLGEVIVADGHPDIRSGPGRSRWGTVPISS